MRHVKKALSRVRVRRLKGGSKLLLQGTGKATAPTTSAGRLPTSPEICQRMCCVTSEVVLIVGPGAPDWWVFPIEIPFYC